MGKMIHEDLIQLYSKSSLHFAYANCHILQITLCGRLPPSPVLSVAHGKNSSMRENKIRVRSINSAFPFLRIWQFSGNLPILWWSRISDYRTRFLWCRFCVCRLNTHYVRQICCGCAHERTQTGEILNTVLQKKFLHWSSITRLAQFYMYLILMLWL